MRNSVSGMAASLEIRQVLRMSVILSFFFSSSSSFFFRVEKMRGREIYCANQKRQVQKESPIVELNRSSLYYLV